MLLVVKYHTAGTCVCKKALGDVLYINGLEKISLGIIFSPAILTTLL